MGKKPCKGRTTGNKTPEKMFTGRNTCENETQNHVDVKFTTSKKADFVEDDVEQCVFPRGTCWVIFALTLISRLWYVTTPTNWWIMYPDEVYQTVEVAHSEAFGYGFRPYEYWPPPGKSNFSTEHERYIQHGMYSLRSFLLVKVFAMVMLLADAIGVTASPFFVIKSFHVIVTSCPPLAVFKFTKALYISRDIATLAAISTSLSFSLNLLGTHTLINSFLSPFLFASLTPLVSTLNSVRRYHLHQSPTCTRESGEIYKTSSPEPLNTTTDGSVNENKQYQGSLSKTMHCHNDNRHGSMMERKTKYSSRTTRNGIKMDVIYGVVLGICVYMRTDTILIPAVVCLLFISEILTNMNVVILNLFEYLLGVAFGMVIGGYVDSLTYGVWFISVQQWFKFNILYGYSATFFGSMSARFYVDLLFNREPISVVACSVLLLDVIVRHLSCKSNLSQANNVHLAKNTSFAFCAILFIYTLFGHKELRFLHNGILLLYISLARAVYNICRFLSFTRNQNQYQYYGKAFYLLFTMLFSCHIYSFFNLGVGTIIKLENNRSVDAGANICMDYIRKQADVSGVFLEKDLFYVGGYSLLHQDVPVFSLYDNAFIEYDKFLTVSEYFSKNIGSGFSCFIKISDLISVFNGKYLIKVLINKSQYTGNYIVIPTNKRFMEIGYEEVFRTETARVLKRTFLKKEETELATIADRIPMGRDASILEYEGHLLRRYGVYQKAEERLLFANKIDETRLGPFQILMEIYTQLNSKENFQNILNTCKEHHKESDCLKPYAPFKLSRNNAL